MIKTTIMSCAAYRKHTERWLSYHDEHLNITVKLTISRNNRVFFPKS